MSMEFLTDAVISRHSKISFTSIEYGTAGFRAKASELDHVVFRMGLLAVLRSKVRNATIGVMITASHNPVEDNGVKLIDPDGEMLESSWEHHATLLANVSDDKLPSQVESIMNEANINSTNVARVVLARDTRPSGINLSEALKDGITALRGEFTDFGVLSTPQLHYIVRCVNSSGCYGNPTELGYYNKLSTAFRQLYSITNCAVYQPVVRIDGANGVGALKLAEMMKFLEATGFSVEICNDGSRGQLNDMCGADYVKVQQLPPAGMPVPVGVRCASFDGDADRLLYFYKDNDDTFRLVDGDKITSLIAKYLSELVQNVGISLNIGVIQTAYANGASTKFINTVANLPVECVPTGVKYLHHAAQQFDIGIYFEANGHGTVLFSPSSVDKMRHVSQSEQFSIESRSAANRLLQTVDLINQTVGDAVSDMLLVECILATFDWDVQRWNSMYTDLPNRQLKVKVKDRRAIQTTDAERRTTAPAGLQSAIDQIVLKYGAHGRSFVRPSGTEDVVRVYAEADTQVNADMLAYEVATAAYNMAGGIGDLPKHP